MTLTQIRTEIRNITGISSTTVIADSVLNDLINKGQIILADEANLSKNLTEPVSPLAAKLIAFFIS